MLAACSMCKATVNYFQLTDHGKIGSEESQPLLTVIKIMGESNPDHFIQTLEVENLHNGHQYLVEIILLVEDMEDQNLQ